MTDTAITDGQSIYFEPSQGWIIRNPIDTVSITAILRSELIDLSVKEAGYYSVLMEW